MQKFFRLVSPPQQEQHFLINCFQPIVCLIKSKKWILTVHKTIYFYFSHLNMCTHMCYSCSGCCHSQLLQSILFQFINLILFHTLSHSIYLSFLFVFCCLFSIIFPGIISYTAAPFLTPWDVNMRERSWGDFYFILFVRDYLMIINVFVYIFWMYRKFERKINSKFFGYRKFCVATSVKP